MKAFTLIAWNHKRTSSYSYSDRNSFSPLFSLPCVSSFIISPSSSILHFPVSSFSSLPSLLPQPNLSSIPHPCQSSLLRLPTFNIFSVLHSPPLPSFPSVHHSPTSTFLSLFPILRPLPPHLLSRHLGGGGPTTETTEKTTTEKTKDILHSCDFPGGMIFFVLCLKPFLNKIRQKQQNKKKGQERQKL